MNYINPISNDDQIPRNLRAVLQLHRHIFTVDINDIRLSLQPRRASFPLIRSRHFLKRIMHVQAMGKQPFLPHTSISHSHPQARLPHIHTYCHIPIIACISTKLFLSPAAVYSVIFRTPSANPCNTCVR
jgi:hypothetical protein